MNKNKKKIVLLSLTSLLSVSLLVITGLISFSHNGLFSTKADVPYSCEYYFDEDNGYTSLYELNKSKVDTGNNINNAKTWGTVTCNYANSNADVFTSIIQSTDKNGHVSSTTLYNIPQNSCYVPGTMVTVTGVFKDYNGMSQMQNCVVTRNVNSNPYPPVPYLLETTPLTNSARYKEYRYMGTRLVRIENVSLGNVGNQFTWATLPDNSQIKLYYSSISNISFIKNKLTEVKNNGNANVEGYLVYYTNNSEFQIYLRDPDNITPNTSVYLSEISIGIAKTEYNVGDTFEAPNVYAVYSDGTSELVTDGVTFTGYNMNVAGSYTVIVSYQGVTTNYQINVSGGSQNLYSESVFISGIGSYSTGNYGQSGNFEYYRGVRSSGNVIKLLPLATTQGIDTLGGSLYNINPYMDIDCIDITYSTSGSNGQGNSTLYFGENHYCDDYVYLPFSTSSTSRSIDLTGDDVNYFKIDSCNTELTIESLTIYYSGENTSNGYAFANKDANQGQTRREPTIYSGNLVDGVSYVDVPTNVNGTQTKRYTYYSYQYVEDHPQYVSVAAMTSAVDVSNYYLAFGCAPANFGIKNRNNDNVDPLRDGLTLPLKSEVDDLFGDDARIIQEFSRTNGYATSVPYYDYTDYENYPPVYYEFDIDVTGAYSTSSRGVGRIVAWSTGYLAPGYGAGTQPVCTFTDDHYATFAEYNNYGGFMPRFNAERLVAGALWSAPTTL